MVGINGKKLEKTIYGDIEIWQQTVKKCHLRNLSTVAFICILTIEVSLVGIRKIATE